MPLNNRPQLLKDGALADDPFNTIGADEPIVDGPVIISPDRFAEADQPGSVKRISDEIRRRMQQWEGNFDDQPRFS